MPDLGRCPICRSPITHSEPNPNAHEPYVPAVMWICAKGHRIYQPDRSTD